MQIKLIEKLSKEQYNDSFAWDDLDSLSRYKPGTTKIINKETEGRRWAELIAIYRR